MARPRFGVLVYVAVAVGIVGVGLSQRSTAVVPPARSMPPAAPDDPAAYRGVRYTPSVEDRLMVEGRIVSWLMSPYAGLASVGDGSEGATGWRVVSDGRRSMAWFVHTVGPFPSPTAQAGSFSFDSTQPGGPTEAVLDVAVLPGPLGSDSLKTFCGADLALVPEGTQKPVAAWDFDRGRLRPVDVHPLRCPNPEERD